MKRVLFVIVSLLLMIGTSFAQQHSGQNGKERIEQQVRQYTADFSLNGAKAEQFSVLYREYSKKLHAIQVLYRHQRPAEGTTLTDEQVEKRILDNFAQSRAILDVREHYYKEFRKILTPTQINRIFEDEKARRAQMKR